MPHMYALFLSGIMEMVSAEPEQLGSEWVITLRTRKGFQTTLPERFTNKPDADVFAASLKRSYTAVHPMTIRHDPHGLAGKASKDDD